MDLNSPVLSELFLKAPGTYQHSMAVATISENVANEIGANSLLVRVG
ncbi:MAG: HDIG domain-containing metalloprotein, partial [Acidobacteriota bacterium]